MKLNTNTGVNMDSLLALQQELLDKITYQRERFGTVDMELLYQYDRLAEYIDNLNTGV